MQRRTIKDISVEGFLRKKPSNRVVRTNNYCFVCEKKMFKRDSGIFSLRCRFIQSVSHGRINLQMLSIEDTAKLKNLR